VSETTDWRDVIGYEGLYKVSECGRVRSVSRRVATVFGATRGVPPKELAQRQAENGYLRVGLSREGVQRGHPVHVLVARAFVEGWAPGLQVNHLDRNRQNNRASNLEWVTAAENMAHAVAAHVEENGRHWAGRGPKNPNARFASEEVAEMRAMRADGKTLREIATVFSLDVSSVGKIVRGKLYKECPGPICQSGRLDRGQGRPL
jgi:hypothetical protein